MIGKRKARLILLVHAEHHKNTAKKRHMVRGAAALLSAWSWGVRTGAMGQKRRAGGDEEITGEVRKPGLPCGQASYALAYLRATQRPEEPLHIRTGAMGKREGPGACKLRCGLTRFARWPGIRFPKGNSERKTNPERYHH